VSLKYEPAACPSTIALSLLIVVTQRTMGIYDSLALPNDKKSIRLLTIEPSRNYNSLVICHLRVVSIGKDLEYEALSYTWGDPKDRAPICVGGEETLVTKNLAAALHALRDPTETRTLWIDAICINQEDLDEKSFQVPMMTLIYKSCSRTIIWLGESDKDSRKAFKIIREGAREYPREVSSVLRRQWFRRMWIIQEVSLAPKAFVQCGKDGVDWEKLAAAVALVPQLGSMVNPNGSGAHLHPAFFPRILNAARKRIQDGTPFDLHEALRCFQPFDATMPVDKVFGILGLISDPSLVQVDYKLSPQEVYTRVAVRTITHTKSLDIFLDCQQQTQGHQLPDLPSWVPDWSTTDGPLDNPMETVTAKEIFHASRDTPLGDPIRATNGVLTLQGHLIGSIADLGEPIPSINQIREKYWPAENLLPHRRAFEIINEAPAIFNTWKAVICRSSQNTPDRTLSDPYATGETLLEALYHTLNSNGGPFADAESDRKFTTWMHSIEFFLKMLEVYGRIVAKLPWLLAWLITGPLCITASSLVAVKLLRKSFVIDAPVQHSDPSRQSSVVGRTDGDLAGLFPAPSLTTPNTVPSRVGDSIVLFRGGSRPYVIRREEGGRWRLIGNAYVHGIMYGAAFREKECVDIELV
jgi:hypothetical protein